MRNLLIATTVAFLLTGCASSKSPSPEDPMLGDEPRASIKADGYEYEHITATELELKEIMATPTNFNMKFEDNAQAWERAQMFFNEYTTKGGEMTLKARGNDTVERLVSPSSSKDAYRYAVERKTNKAGIEYWVRCVVNKNSSTKQIADRNARNLSRFVKTGKLDRTLLVR